MPECLPIAKECSKANIFALNSCWLPMQNFSCIWVSQNEQNIGVSRCRGPIILVPQAAAYGPITWTRPTSPAEKQLGASPPVPGMAPQLLAREEGLPVWRGPSRVIEHTTRDPGTSQEPNGGLGCQALKEPHRVGPHLAGHDDKHHMSSHRKVSKLQTLKLFRSMHHPWGLKPSPPGKGQPP
jgi:hypothetical protein